MDNKKWLELIEQKKEEILIAGEKAYAESLNNTQLRYIVELNNNGEIYTWYDIAGGNSYHMSTHNGESIEVLHFCNQYYEPEITSGDIKSKLIEKGYENMIEELEERAKDDYTSIECVIMNGDYMELTGVVEELREEFTSAMICEYARSDSEDKLDYLVTILEDLK